MPCGAAFLAKRTRDCKRKISKIAFFFNRRANAIVPVLADVPNHPLSADRGAGDGAISHANAPCGFSNADRETKDECAIYSCEQVLS